MEEKTGACCRAKALRQGLREKPAIIQIYRRHAD
ncbi:hypothetical protein ABIF38_006599 [Bradyrhizobium japonicum]|jgi:hypothetical protein|uniref:Transposase n=1 Tax=Bradyrhizobium elkanii TaxID=29448 RepID=A0ABV4F196_BRAEL|nr:hypothetical protein [Bradyrhizobium elkanii]MCP1731093.1 hypothetical protein [Bradyrhizobium elkanii]MCP1758097.1 hypothetical protein [Bradyrhizobium elkanii]MCP1969842.1 hypothetical protein [Bradyrhizobium elkanii]MCP1983414.1 hypothetical protein [Bradyrhizobium elkanii]